MTNDNNTTNITETTEAAGVAETITDAAPDIHATVKPPAPTKPTHKKRSEKTRTIYELAEATPNSMSQPEAIKYIKYLREENEKLHMKYNAMEDNAKSAYLKLNNVVAIQEKIVTLYEQQIQFLKSNLQNLQITVNSIHDTTQRHIADLQKGL